MSSFEDRVQERRRNFKKGVDCDDARRNREDEAVQLRKKDKEEQLNKKRQQTLGGSAPSAAQSDTFPPSNIGPLTQPNGAPCLDNLHVLVQQVRFPSDDQSQFQSTQHIRKLLSIEQNPPIQEVIDTQVVPDFIKLLQKESHPNTQFEAAWALTNIASGSNDQTKCVVDHGAVPIFVSLLQSPNDSVREQAVWALGNIAGDSPACRDLVLSAGALDPLLREAQNEDKIVMQRNATWTLSNFCRGKPPPPMAAIAGCLGTLSSLIHHKQNDVEVLTDACWALSYFCDGDPERIQAVLDVGIANRIVKLLEHVSPLVQTPALRVLGNIVTGDDNQTQIVIASGALENLRKLLTHHKKGIRKEASWTISNITAGNRSQIQSVIESGIFKPLVKMLGSSEFEVKKEVCWAISNATSGGSDQQIMDIVDAGAIAPLVEMLNCPDQKIASVSLEALQNILKVGATKPDANGNNAYMSQIEEANGFDILERLQQEGTDDIYAKAMAVMAFFPTEEDTGMCQATNADGGFQQFGAQAPMQGFSFS